MNGLHFTTHHQPVAARPECWSSIVRPYFGDLDVEPLGDLPLDAVLDVYTVGPLRLYRLEAPPHRVQRVDMHRELPFDGSYKLILLLQGRTEIRMCDRAFVLRAGDWSLYDPHVPYAITNHEQTSKLMVQIPRALLPGMKATSLHTGEADSAGQVALSAMFGALLRSLVDQLPTLPETVGQPVSDSMLGLLTSTMAVYRQEAAEPATLLAVMKQRVKQYIATHLSDPQLSIERIARDLRCSKRYLHKIFEDEVESLERYVWHSRLARCQSALSESQRPVADIAFAWGFSSSAHFSRTFRNRFGVSPSEWRARHAQSHRARGH